MLMSRSLLYKPTVSAQKLSSLHTGFAMLDHLLHNATRVPSSAVNTTGDA